MITTAAGQRARLRLAPAAMCAGLVVLMIGTFLPWLESGRVSRNSYAGDSALRELVDVGGALDAVLRAWPFVGLACAAAVALVLLGRTRTGAVLGGLAAACAAALAGWALQSPAHGVVRPAGTGPATTLIGAALSLLAALPILLPMHRPTRRPL